MITLIENGEVYAPEPRGRNSVLIVGDRIAAVGQIQADAVKAIGLETLTVDATNCLVTPGLIDPHEHLLGGSGEKGFSTQTPEIFLSELIQGGITTVVGCLGVDTTTKTMPGLLARAKAINEEGLTAHVYTGGYRVPATTLTGSVRNDILFVQEVIGAGEIALSDLRALEPDEREVARLVSDAYAGGILSRKAGITHFHLGDGKNRAALLRSLLDHYEIPTSTIYPTHVERNQALMEEAIELTRRGVVVDLDVVEQDLAKWLRLYLDSGADPSRITASSDASITSPATLLNQIRDCALRHSLPFELVLSFVTSNTARVLKLERKGRLEPGNDADVLIFRRDSLELRDVFGRGRCFMRDGRLSRAEAFLTESNRRISLAGRKSL